MKVEVEESDDKNPKRVKLTLDCGTRFYLQQTGDGQRLEVFAPDGGPVKVLPVVANVVEVEGKH